MSICVIGEIEPRLKEFINYVIEETVCRESFM